MPKPRPRDSQRLRLKVASARTMRLPAEPTDPPLLPWPIAAVGGGVLAGVAGGVLVAALVMLAWFSATAIGVPTALAFAGQVWLLSNGGVLSIGSDQVTLVPLGMTAINLVLCAWAGGFGYRQGRASRVERISPAQSRNLALATAVQVTLGYAGLAVAVSLGTGSGQPVRAVAGACVVALLGSLTGVLVASDAQHAAPDWLRAGLRGAAAGSAGLVVAGCVVLIVTLIQSEVRMTTLETAIAFDQRGNIVWAAVLLSYLPDFLGWALAWVLGGGFTVGTDTLVSLWATRLGMVPSIPVFGALPADGVTSQWLLAWLAAGLLAGALAGVVALRRHGTGVVGALVASGMAGLLTGVGFVVLAVASRGSLGELRMAQLGPQFPESLFIPVPLLVLSALAAGTAMWLIRQLRARPRPAAGSA